MANTTAKKLEGLDITFIVDRSGSMATKEANGKTRWENAAEVVTAMAAKAEKYDADGIDLFTFSGKFKKYSSVGAEAVAKVFVEEEPNGSTNLGAVLTDAFAGFFERFKAGTSKPNGELFIVVTDGEPDSRPEVKKAIIEAANKLEKDDDLGVLFVQSGNDAGAMAFLKSLDDDLSEAKFDIVDTITMQDVGEKSLAEVFAGAFED